MAVVKGNPNKAGTAKSTPPPSATTAEANQKLAEFAKTQNAKTAEPKKRADGLANLPALPRARKAKAPKDCACGCGLKTKGGRYLPGHDGRPRGWAIRVERDIVKLKDIPEGERKVVSKLLKEREAMRATGKDPDARENLNKSKEQVEAEVDEAETEEGEAETDEEATE